MLVYQRVNEVNEPTNRILGQHMIFLRHRSGMWRPGPTLSGDTSQPIIHKMQRIQDWPCLYGWWFQPWILFSIIYWESWSQLTFTFFRGVAQPPTSYACSWNPYLPSKKFCWRWLRWRSCFFFRIRGSSRNQSDHIQKNTSDWLHPLVNCRITMENHNFQWVNMVHPLFLWPFSIAILT